MFFGLYVSFQVFLGALKVAAKPHSPIKPAKPGRGWPIARQRRRHAASAEASAGVTARRDFALRTASARRHHRRLTSGRENSCLWPWFRQTKGRDLDQRGGVESRLEASAAAPIRLKFSVYSAPKTGLDASLAVRPSWVLPYSSLQSSKPLACTRRPRPAGPARKAATASSRQAAPCRSAPTGPT